MRILGFVWGLVGVLMMLMFAITRLSARVIDLQYYDLSIWHWLSLVLFLIYMLYSEGYKGFHLNFSPRVVLRAQHLLHKPSFGLMIFAPLFCMGYFHATRRRKIVSLILTAVLILVVFLVSYLPQPWRGVVDVGVVGGLSVGVLSILYYCVLGLKGQEIKGVEADLPESESEQEVISVPE